jgi:anti-sigma28 factor (negative regulator of flagellin synthesis)
MIIKMKINRNEVDNIYNSIIKSSVSASEKEQSKAIGAEKDSLVISSEAKSHSGVGGIVKQAVSEVIKPTASEKLLHLKNEISNGTYHVSGGSIAEAMLGYVGRGDEK